MKKNRTYRTNAFLAMMLAGSFLAGTTSLASESQGRFVVRGGRLPATEPHCNRKGR